MEPQEVKFEREYAAPIEEVWEAWTTPAKVKQWWGPGNVTIPECAIDPRVGGEFSLVMEADESMGELKGTRWPMEATFTEVEKPTRLAFTSKSWQEDEDATTVIEQASELSLSDEGGKTKMLLSTKVTSTGPRAGEAVKGLQYGYNMQFDKLGNFLKK
jgi:uncharacterized protein YndB with AHSA1/START domain